MSGVQVIVFVGRRFIVNGDELSGTSLPGAMCQGSNLRSSL